MELVSTLSVSMSAILKLATTIASLAMATRRNKTECQELAERAREVTRILKNGKATSTTKGTLDALNKALQDAHEIVESCCRGDLFIAFQADKFKDINKSIRFWLKRLHRRQRRQLEQ
uniref:Pectinesterase inhibitor domain-containing protein n=1 Tax=Leersia perrieri TaxID=77586 RepID=A0A0D9XV08_9ORYZ